MGGIQRLLDQDRRRQLRPELLLPGLPLGLRKLPRGVIFCSLHLPAKITDVQHVRLVPQPPEDRGLRRDIHNRLTEHVLVGHPRRLLGAPESEVAKGVPSLCHEPLLQVADAQLLDALEEDNLRVDLHEQDIDEGKQSESEPPTGASEPRRLPLDSGRGDPASPVAGRTATPDPAVRRTAAATTGPGAATPLRTLGGPGAATPLRTLGGPAAPRLDPGWSSGSPLRPPASFGQGLGLPSRPGPTAVCTCARVRASAHGRLVPPRSKNARLRAFPLQRLRGHKNSTLYWEKSTLRGTRCRHGAARDGFDCECSPRVPVTRGPTHGPRCSRTLAPPTGFRESPVQF
eukprot:11228352-Lingulodinium_polyedra.AAC.1